MKFVPFDRFSLITPLSPKEAAERLGDSVAEPKFRLFDKPTEAFVGRVSVDGFKISPVIGYRNSFIPVIIGTFDFNHNGARINVTQRLPIFATVFLSVWAFMFLSIGGPITLLSDRLQDALFPFGIFAFAWIITTGGFWWEARNTKDELMFILKAREDNPV